MYTEYIFPTFDISKEQVTFKFNQSIDHIGFDKYKER